MTRSEAEPPRRSYAVPDPSERQADADTGSAQVERRGARNAHAELFHGAIGIPFVGGNKVERLLNGVEIFPAMIDAIRAAQDTIEFETYVYWEGVVAVQVANALAEASGRGVQVRVLIDGAGSFKMEAKAREVLESSGVELAVFQPVRPWRLKRMTHRTHRKILVCDSQIGFTGGVGIATEWEGDARSPEEWRETHFRIEGPAVTGLRAAFFHHWLSSADGVDGLFPVTLLERDGVPTVCGEVGDTPVQVVPSEATGRWSRQETLFRAAIRGATKRLWITTAYFVPDDDLIQLLIDASRRGVDVRILLPGPHIDFTIVRLAGEAVYDELMDAGIRIWRYQPTMIHAKILMVDGVTACIGSANMNHRSLMKDDEIALVVLDQALVERLENDFREDLANAIEVEPGHTWDERPWWRKLLSQLSLLFRGEL